MDYIWGGLLEVSLVGIIGRSHVGAKVLLGVTEGADGGGGD